MEDINKFFVGTALTKLKQLENDSVDLVITSPPYWNAVVYDKDVNTDYESYLDNLTEIFSALQHLKFNKHEIILFHLSENKTEFELDFKNFNYF